MKCKAYVRQELEENRALRRAGAESLQDHFEDQFSPKNFIACWSFMKDYLDVEGSSAKGKWFMQSKQSQQDWFACPVRV